MPVGRRRLVRREGVRRREEALAVPLEARGERDLDEGAGSALADLRDLAAEQLGDVDRAVAGHGEVGRAEEPGGELAHRAAPRVHRVDRPARTEARVLGSAGERRHVEHAARAHLDVRRDGLEPARLPDDARGPPEARRRLGGDDRGLRGQHGHRPDPAAVAHRQDRVGARVGDVRGAAGRRRRVRVGVRDPRVPRRDGRRGDLGDARRVGVAQVVGHAAVGIVRLLVRERVREHDRRARRVAPPVGPQRRHLRRDRTLLAELRLGERDPTAVVGDAAHLAAVGRRVEDGRGAVAADGREQPGEVLGDVGGAARSDGEAERRDEAGRDVGHGRRARRGLAAVRDGGPRDEHEGGGRGGDGGGQGGAESSHGCSWSGGPAGARGAGARCCRRGRRPRGRG